MSYSSHRTRRLVTSGPCTCHPDAFAPGGARPIKAPEGRDEPSEPAEITNIVYRIIANEWQIRTKLAGILSSCRDLPSVLSSRTLNWAMLPRTMLTFWAG